MEVSCVECLAMTGILIAGDANTMNQVVCQNDDAQRSSTLNSPTLRNSQFQALIAPSLASHARVISGWIVGHEDVAWRQNRFAPSPFTPRPATSHSAQLA